MIILDTDQLISAVFFSANTLKSVKFTGKVAVGPKFSVRAITTVVCVLKITATPAASNWEVEFPAPGCCKEININLKSGVNVIPVGSLPDGVLPNKRTAGAAAVCVGPTTQI